MYVAHRRWQHPVGQGFFHSGELYGEDQTCRLRYVVDCGSKATYQLARETQIDNFISSVGSGGMLDLLLISHVHEDHVNGIEHLLNARTGLKIDTIMMPLMTVEERLIAFARSVAEDPAVAGNAFYRQFVVNPVAALSQFGPRRIILVRPGRPDDGAPGSGGDPTAPLPDGEKPRDPEDKKARAEWRLTGKGQIEDRTNPSRRSRAGGAIRVSEIPDSVGIAAPVGDSQWEWLIAPYVDPKVEKGVVKFEQMLARRLGIKVANLRKKLGNTAYIQDLVINKVDKLKAAYLKITTDLNVTSLCVYSGPAALPKTGEHRCTRLNYGENWLGYCGRGGWLGTGDAALKEQVRLKPFLLHYGRLLDEVTTLTMPHHGSDGNFHPDLLDHVKPTYCVAAADKMGNWRHPGTSVVQSVASRGLLLLVATAADKSKIYEQLDILDIW